MPFYPQSAVGLVYLSYPAGPTPAGTTLTAAGSTNTKGSYAEITASTSATTNRIKILVERNVATAGRLYNFDLATGAGGAESVKIPDLMCEGLSSTSSRYGHGLFPLNLQIASGTRIAMRCQCSSANETIVVQVILAKTGDVDGCASFTNYGADTANSGGTAVDSGGTANTKGAYSELTASTSAIIQELLLNCMMGHTGVLFSTWLLDLSTGAAAAEVVLIPDLMFSLASSGSGTQPQFVPASYEFQTYIAASTRIAVRTSCTRNDTPERIIDALIVGSVAPSESSGGGGGSWAFMG